MMTREENDQITRVGRGSPCGALLRRYWQPVALSTELPPGGPPLPVQLLGEDLVLFRDETGRAGLLGIHCAHRGADLSYGRLENGGLRCIYHGWLYDIHGKCLDQPGEPDGRKDCGAIRQLSYPCEEHVGVVFAYLGGGEPPLFPNLEFLSAREDRVFVSKIRQDCNFLQANEGNIDPVHLSFLHRKLEEQERDKARAVRGSTDSPNTLFGKDIAPAIDVELTSFGVRIYTRRTLDSERQYVRVSYFILPNLSAFPGQTGGDVGYTVNWHVPINDESHFRYVFVYSRSQPLDLAFVLEGRSELTADFRLKRNKSNRYLQDRAAMQTETFSGIGYNFQAQDACVTEGAGAVQDRTQEHLVSSDKAIVAARKLMLKAIRDIQEGGEAPGVFREAALNRFPELVVVSEVIAAAVDCREHVKQKETELRL